MVAAEASEEALAVDLEEALTVDLAEASEEATGLTDRIFMARILAVGFSDRDFLDTDMAAAASEVCSVLFSYQ